MTTTTVDDSMSTQMWSGLTMRISYDAESKLLEIILKDVPATTTATDDDRVMTRIAEDGEIVGVTVLMNGEDVDLVLE